MTDLAATGVDPGRATAVCSDWEPRIVALVCNWCSYAGADMAGTTRLEYPANIRLVRFPCTGRMSPMMIVRAFEEGADGVLVSGCHPGDCHYVQGNLIARRRFTIFRSLMDFLGFDLRRLHFAWVSAAEGHKWASVVSQVTDAVREAGPLPSRATAEALEGVEVPGGEERGSPGLSIEEVTVLKDHLRRAAADLLASGRIGAVLGYRSGSLPGRLVPTIIGTAADCPALEWGDGAVHNLVRYVRDADNDAQRVAIVAKTCDLPAVNGLIREGQLDRDQIFLIGVECPGVRAGSQLAVKCLSCEGAPHPSCDLVITRNGVTESTADPDSEQRDGVDARDRQIEYLESLTASQRWAYWQQQFGRCLRCYACRGVCPMCYCSACIAEKHRPQWVSPAIDYAGNSAWNIIRAFHLAGRCGGCDECARACPADIRLDLINRKLALEIERQFGSTGLDPKQKGALADFRMNDSEEYIL